MIINALSLIHKTPLGIQKRSLWPHQNQSNTSFAACCQRLSYHFINKTHSPYFCIKGDAISQGHAEWRKDLCHRDQICQYPYFVTQGRGSLLGHGAGRWRESSAGCPSSAVQRHPVTGHNPQEGADLAAKPHSSNVTGGLPPSFYSAAYCICRYMHQ